MHEAKTQKSNEKMKTKRDAQKTGSGNESVESVLMEWESLMWKGFVKKSSF